MWKMRCIIVAVLNHRCTPAQSLCWVWLRQCCDDSSDRDSHYSVNMLWFYVKPDGSNESFWFDKKINILYNLPVCFHSVLFLLVSVLNLLVHWKFGRPTWTCCSRLLSLEGSVKNMWTNPPCGLLLLLFAVLLVLWFSPCCGEEMPKYATEC